MIHAHVHLDDKGNLDTVALTADEPVRFDLSRHKTGELLLYVYEGAEADLDQDPYLAIDGLYPPEPDTETARLTVTGGAE